MSTFDCMILGGDVSFNQGYCEWDFAWDEGVRWNWIRFSQRGLYPPPDQEDWKDPRRHDNWIDAGKTNILRGAYSVWDERAGHLAEDHAEGFQYAFQPYFGIDEGELPHLFDLEVFPITWPEVLLYLIWLDEITGKKPIIYTGSWVIAQAALYGIIPDWLEDYEFYLTGYNDSGPDLYGPLGQMNITVVAWQQTSSWHTPWTFSDLTDRGYWIKDYWRFAKMADEKVVNSNDMILWIQENSFECEKAPPPPPPNGEVFDLGSPLPEPLSQWRMSQDFNLNYFNYSNCGGHDGVDWACIVGTELFAAHEGEVIVAGFRPNRGSSDPYGCHVRIQTRALDFNGVERVFTTIYGHMSRVDVAVGDYVFKGESLGLSGGAVGDPCAGRSTGPHLHFGVLSEGAYDRKETYLKYDFMNPWIWLTDISTEPINRYRVKPGVYLNVRNLPGLDNTVVRYTMGPGQVFDAYELTDVGDYPWAAQDVSRTAWNSIYPDYVELI